MVSFLPLSLNGGGEVKLIILIVGASVGGEVEVSWTKTSEEGGRLKESRR